MMDYSPFVTWYEKEAGKAPEFEPLASSLEADVCIIGSGFIGLCAALKLAGEGKSVVVLEPGRLTFGNGGRTGGFLESGVRASVDDIADLLGRLSAHRLWQYSIDARAQVLEMIRSRGISCHLQQGVSCVALHTSQKNDMHKQARYLTTHFEGQFAESLDEGGCKRAGFDAPAGVRWPGNAVFNPISFLFGLVEASQESGVKIFEQTPIVSYEQQNHIFVKTKHATVRADKMLVCGNAYMDILQSPERTQTVSADYFQIATQPLDEATLRAAFPEKDAFVTNSTLRHYVHVTDDNRIVIGGPKPFFSPKNKEKFAAKQLAFVTKKMPTLAGKLIADYLWQGKSGVPMNFLPVFHREDENIYAAHGFNGHGVALSVMAGDALAVMALRDSSDVFELFARVRQKPLPRVMHHLIAKVALFVYRVRDAVLCR